jgi:hypothetical protein
MVSIPSIRLNPVDNMTQRLEQIGKLSTPGADIEHRFPTRQQRLDLPKPRQRDLARTHNVLGFRAVGILIRETILFLIKLPGIMWTRIRPYEPTGSADDSP